MHKSLLILLFIASLPYMVMFYVAPVSSDSEVRVAGFSFQDSIDINGPVVVKFQLIAKEPITSVVLSYVDINEKWVNTTMSLTEGDAENGWWEATILLRIHEEKTEMTLRYIPNPMQLYVTLPNKMIELEIPQEYFPMTTFQSGNALLSMLPMLLPFLLTIGGFSAIVIVIVSKRRSIKKTTP